MNAAMFSRKICQFELQPCRNSSGGPLPPVSRTLTSWPSITIVRWRLCQSTPIHAASSPSAYVGSGPGRRSALRTTSAICRVAAPRRELPYQRVPHEHRDRHRLHAAPLLGPALRRRAAAVRHRAALRGAGDVGDHAAAPRAGARVRGGDPLRAPGARRRALPRRGRGRARLARRRPLHPHHLAPRRPPRTTRPSAGCGRSSCRTTSCTAPTTRSAAAARSASTS